MSVPMPTCVDAEQADEVVGVAAPLVEVGDAFAAVAERPQADEAAGGGDGPELVVGVEPGEVAHGGGTGVGADHRLARRADPLAHRHRRGGIGVGEVDEDAGGDEGVDRLGPGGA